MDERAIDGGSFPGVEPDEELPGGPEGGECRVDDRFRVGNELEDTHRHDQVEGWVARDVLSPPVQERHAVAVAREVPLGDEVPVRRLDRDHVRRTALEHHRDDPSGTAADLGHAPAREVLAGQ